MKQIVILAGLPLTGKTEVGRKLAPNLDAEFLDVDETRQEIMPGKTWLGPKEERQIMLASYERNHEKGRAVLRTGRTAILAATYSRPVYHKMAHELAASERVPLRILLLEIPDSEVVRRLKKRRIEGTSSNIQSLQSYQEVRGRYQPPPDAIRLDATQSISKLVEAALQLVA